MHIRQSTIFRMDVSASVDDRLGSRDLSLYRQDRRTREDRDNEPRPVAGFGWAHIADHPDLSPSWLAGTAQYASLTETDDATGA